MNRHLDMCCHMCSKQVYEADHISVDRNGNVIVMCPQCYERAKEFFDGGAKNVKS